MTKADLQLLSLNQITTENWSLSEAIQGCARHDIHWISIWRHKLEEIGVKEAKKLLTEYGLRVSSLCRGGMFPAATERERQQRIDDNKRAIEDAKTLGTDVLVLVCGPAADKNIAQGRHWVEAGIEAILPYTEEMGVKLGIEPLHPMYAADRSVINTLGQANTLAEKLKSDHLGVVVDAFHVWWDPELRHQIDRAKGKILGFHVSDWKVPMKDMFKGRAMMGDGVINLREMRSMVEEAGYQGPIEVEIINQEIWDQLGDEVLHQMKQCYQAHV